MSVLLYIIILIFFMGGLMKLPWPHMTFNKSKSEDGISGG